MLSPDELKHGMTLIVRLDLTATGGGAVHWVETLRGDTAKRSYDIYRRSHCHALRAEAADVFHRRGNDAELQSIRKQRRGCVFIHALAVNADEVGCRPGARPDAALNWPTDLPGGGI